MKQKMEWATVTPLTNPTKLVNGSQETMIIYIIT